MTERLPSHTPEQKRPIETWSFSWLRGLKDAERYLQIRDHTGCLILLQIDQEGVEIELRRSQFKSGDGKTYSWLIFRRGDGINLPIDQRLDIVLTEGQLQDFPLKPEVGHNRVTLPMGTQFRLDLTRDGNFQPFTSFKFRDIAFPSQEVATPAK